MSQDIHLVHLYPGEMNIYGDTGNRLVLKRRLEWRGIKVRVSLIGLNQDVPSDSDIIIGGGGQDAVQSAIQQDLQAKSSRLLELAEKGTTMLMVCGLYQLFGRKFITTQGEDIKGIGLLPVETVAGPERLIGNTIVSSAWGRLVGYENHSGLTNIDSDTQAIGRIEKGAGNNGQDKTEGCILGNVFGTYMHGPLLSKNPKFADELLMRVMERKGLDSSLSQLDDSLELKAAKVAFGRPR